MSNEHSQAEMDEVSSRLSEGLESCRMMIATYRAMLVRGANDNVAQEPPSSDGQRNGRA